MANTFDTIDRNLLASARGGWTPVPPPPEPDPQTWHDGLDQQLKKRGFNPNIDPGGIRMPSNPNNDPDIVKPVPDGSSTPDSSLWT